MVHGEPAVATAWIELETRVTGGRQALDRLQTTVAHSDLYALIPGATNYGIGWSFGRKAR